MRSIITLFGLGLTGCFGTLTYTPPLPAPAAASRSLVIQSPRADVWRTMVPALGKSFFVVNNIDQSSGFINVSYAGDPERYVDCGRIVSEVTDAAGLRHYEFPGARAKQQYQFAENGRLYRIDRNLGLEGRANLVFEELAPSSTRVTVSVRYVLSLHVLTDGRPYAETQGFTSDGMATFESGTKCQSTGAFERELLALVPASAH